ncbi:TPA: crotonase/enoyl-CoA hydratase family protein [Pseudomonas aeruginosa]|nr:crotonase/enoyl-CoA hydratase family protein [Pseudomonas aeruginosa]
MTEYNAFRVELADKIAHVQINRPDKINAMNQDFWREIIEIFRWVDDTDEVRVVVLSGAGKHFSSGIDLMLLAQVGSQLGKDVGRNADALRRKILELQASFNAVDNCRKPVLAAIQGYCLGGAIDLVSACDMRYSTADAQFSIKEIDIGMAADVGTLQRLPRIIGDGMMRELAYTGRMVDGEEARSIGLVNRTYADQAALMDGVFELARQIAAKSPIAIRGTLNLIELAGAELLAQEALQLATDIPTGVSEERDGQLAALGNALYVLRRYLENVEANRQEIPELLLPAINEVRCAAGQPALPESFFFSARLDIPRPPSTAIDHLPSEAELGEESRRMRHMYQIGLLGLIREQNLYPSLKLMGRALARLDSLHGGVARSRLCWIGAAAIESIVDGQLLPRKSRKQLFSRIDRELKQLLIGPAYEAPRHLLKELLYLVALSDGQGPRSREVRELHGLAPLPFTDHLLEEESQRLSGPGQSVMRSLSTAIREELAGVKDMLDLIERGVAQPDSLTNLHAQLGKLSKTLGMVGLNSAGTALQTQLPTVAAWAASGVADSPPALLRLADAVLYVESMVGNLERGERRIIRPTPAEPGQEADAFAVHQLAEARIVVIEEAKAGLALAKRAITAYLESNGDKLNLANVPASLQAVRGGLWFLGQERAALLVGGCADYIQQRMIETAQMPSEQMLETLADALTSLEYYLEGGAVLRPQGQPDVLDLASASVKALGLPVAA